jgi:hypothetical protein
MADAEQVKDAAEVYVYGYPLVYDLKEVAGFVEGGGSLPMQAPYVDPDPRAGRGAGRRPTSGPGQDRGAGQGRRGCARWLEQRLARVRP